MLHQFSLIVQKNTTIMFKLVCLSAVIALAFAAPQVQDPNSPFYRQVQYHSGAEANARILNEENDIAPDGSGYQWAFQTENGISQSAQATFRAINQEEVAQSVQGSYEYQTPEGVKIQVQYVSDENGYRPVVKYL